MVLSQAEAILEVCRSMRYRALDEDGDMTIGNKNAYIEGASAVRQAISTRLRQLIYEWWEQVEDGVPYWQKVITTRNTKEAERIIKQRIQNTKHVLSILDFNADWNNETRSLTIRAAIQSDYGTLTIEEGL